MNNTLYKFFLLAIIAITSMGCSEEQDSLINNEISISTLSKSGGYNDIETANDWNLVMDLGASYGYKLYKNGVFDDYLQKVNLSMGATLQFGFGAESMNSNEIHSPLFKRKLISYFWTNRPAKAISVVNGTFFFYNKVDIDESSCQMSFPVKNAGILRTTGSDNSKQGKRKLGFNFTTQEAWIASYPIMSNDVDNISNCLQSPFVICGYDPDTPEFDESSALAWLKYRLLIGIKDQDNDTYHKNEVIYILSYCGSISDAKDKLIDLGCSASNIIMLDGSDSSQMIAKDPDNPLAFEFNKDARTIPQVIYVCKP